MVNEAIIMPIPGVVTNTAGLKKRQLPGFYDTFDRADSPAIGKTSFEGRQWLTRPIGTATVRPYIASNTLRTTVAGTGTVYPIVRGLASYGTLSADLLAPGTQQGGLVFGINTGSAVDDLIRLQLRVSSSDLRPRMSFLLAGAESIGSNTPSGTYPAGLPTSTATHFDLAWDGATAKLFINNVEAISITPPVATAARVAGDGHGFYIAAGGSGVIWDNIRFAPLAV